MPRSMRLIWILLLLAAICAAGCGRASTAPPPTPTLTGKSAAITVAKPAGEPIVRVRIQERAEEILFTGPARLQVSPLDKPDQKQLLAAPLSIRRVSGQWAGPWSSGAPDPKATLLIEPLGPSPLVSRKMNFPGVIHLTAVNENPKTTRLDRIDAVNHVRLESYLPGVLAQELYANWEPGAYIAQAVAARTYAIWCIMNDGPGRHFDIEAGEASQAYIGQTAHATSVRSVADTAGLVLTWNDRIFPAYYSSTCGGLPQSPTDAFGANASVPPLEPLAERHCCDGARTHHWGPIDLDRVVLSRRIAAWGAYHGLPIAKLGTIGALRVSHVNKLKRPVRFELTDDRGQAFVLRGESLRSAANFGSRDAKVDPPPTAQRLKSSNCDVAIRGDTVRFFNGRGYGHSVGLCQYGAQALARSGKTPLEILGTYYPGAKIDRAY